MSNEKKKAGQPVIENGKTASEKTKRTEPAFSSDIYRSRPTPGAIPPRFHGRRVEQK